MADEHDDRRLTSYAEMAEVVEHLPLLLRETRRRRRMTLRDVAAVSGLATSTVMRVENGHRPHAGVLVALLRFIGDTDSG